MPSLLCPGVARTGLGCCIRAGPSCPLCMRAANARKFSSLGLENLLFIHERKPR
jgi:hypothetical protein